MPAPLSRTSAAPVTADPTDRFERRDGYDEGIQQSSSRRYMSSRRNSLSSFPPRDKQNHYENSEVIRSASGSHLTGLQDQRTDRPDADTFYHNPRNRYKSMPTPPSRTASLAASANLAHQGYVPNGLVYSQEQYEQQQRQSRPPESNFSRNANHRKSALRSFRKWMKNRFKTSKSAPDGFHNDQYHQQQHRPQYTSAYPQRPWEQNASNGSPLYDPQRPTPTPRQSQQHSSQEQPPLPRHQSVPINAQYQPPIQNHQQREPSSRLPPVPALIANVMPPQSQLPGNDAAHYSPDEQDSGVETPSTSEKPAALLRDMPTPCLTGIKNHGNTCYINAVLQCLSATDLLAEYLVTERFARDLEDQTHAQQKISKQFGTNGAATRSLAGFLQRLWFNRYDESVSRDFKALLGQFSADYRTASQQDAQEFLVWLLDKVHEDLNTATKRTYKQASAGKIKGSEEDLADEALVRHRRAHCSYVTNLFEAQFRSSVWCPDCHNTKLNFDPYMCVSLPVPQDTKKPLFVTMVFWNRRPRLLKLGLNADVTAKLGDVKNCLKQAAQVNPHEVVMCDLSESGFRCVFPDATEVVALGSVDKMIYAIETPPTSSPVLDDRFPPSSYESSRANPDDIVVLFCNTVGSEAQSSRRGCPFSLRIDREVSYELLCRRLLAMARPMLRKNIDVLDVPFSAFRLRVADDFAPGVYLDGGVTMPLYTQDVDHALNYGNRAYAGPQTLRLVLEWDPSTQNLYLDDVTEVVLDHQSCADLVEEMKAPAATLMQCLKEYTQTETLEEWRCDSCKRKQRRAEKSLKFRSVPDVLVIHLKRFRHLPDGETVKLDPTVQFPIDSLDLSVFTYHSGTTPVPFRKANGMYQQNRPSTHQSGRSSGHNTWQGRKQRAPSGSSSARQPEQVPPGGALYVNTEQSQNLYDLFAVVNHKGESMNSGHYTAFCRNPVDGHWRLFDDTYVQPVDAKQVVSNAAYLLFYERRGSSTRTSCRNSSESGFSDHWFYRLPARIVQKYLNPTQVNGGISSATTPRQSRPATPASTIDDSDVPSFNRNDPKRDPHSPHSPNRAQTPTRANGDVRKPPAPLPRPSLLTGAQQPSQQQSATNWYNNNLTSQQRKTSAHIKSCSAIETDL